MMELGWFSQVVVDPTVIIIRDATETITNGTHTGLQTLTFLGPNLSKENGGMTPLAFPKLTMVPLRLMDVKLSSQVLAPTPSKMASTPRPLVNFSTPSGTDSSV